MPTTYHHMVKNAAITASGCAVVLFVIKLVAWWLTGSISLLAAVVDAFVDIAASITNLIILKFALQPPDDEHLFGHGKAESLGALAQSMFISGSAVFLILSSCQQFIQPHPLHLPNIGIRVMLISTLITIALVLMQHWVVKKTGSQVIKADMLHYKSDILMNIAILIALLFSRYNFWQADAIFALIIGIYIFYNAWHIGYDAVQNLLDRALPDHERHLIIDIIKATPEAIGAHDLRTRQSGAIKFIQFHLELDDQLPLYKAHAIADRIEEKLKCCFPRAEVIIHQDPSCVISGKTSLSTSRYDGK